MRRAILILTGCLWINCLTAAIRADDQAAAPALDFNREVAPILVRRCLECHDRRNASGGLVLVSRSTLAAGGDSGPVVEPRRAERSLLVQRVADGEMPPERQGRPQTLPADEIAVLRRWVQSGADWPAGRELDQFEATTDLRAGRDWWSLQPVLEPAVPANSPGEFTSDTQWPEPENPIDAFVRERLRAAGMSPAPPADRRTLIRRVYFDVTGLPPTWEEVERFVADDSEHAWPRLVDRLLASPHYGQRWARHWLDVVRYAETSGYERDQTKPFAWKYRDWVVDALNRDLPYDRFVLEQLAGDELPDRDQRTVVATGLLRLGTWNDEPNDPQDYQYERLEDLVHVTSTAFLGITVKCARCHDHKFDPIPQTDYYRLAAVFWPGPIEARGRELLGGPSSEELGFAEILGWTDVRPRVEPLRMLKSGDRHQPLDTVQPATLSLIPDLFEPLRPAPSDARTTGYRLQLARWIVRPDNPLTARVIVNRLWQHHMGQGLVRSPNNLGFHGERPTHPELLDWLAARLVREGWRLKPIHRLILTSQTYCQSASHPRHNEYAARDFANRNWWRAERRRLDAESLRDALLSVAGRLDQRLGGPSFRPTVSPEALEGLSRKAAAWEASPDNEQRRRTL
ncbi:MAG: PSD1 domain-containing protein, partial [Pirellulaceae bacterium]|nr:PSD1 domain-containing protein [Pirellulaceae bacterium]